VKKIPSFLYPKCPYLILSIQSVVFMLNLVKRIHSVPLCSIKVHFNIILSFMRRSTKEPLSLRYSSESPVYISLLLHTCYISSPSSTLKLASKITTNG